MYAINANHDEIAELLLNAGAKVSGKAAGDTPLAFAAYRGLEKTVRLLLARGANPNVRGDMKRTPLHNAAAEGYLDIAESLLRAGSELNGRDDPEQTPIHLAAAWKHPDIVRFLHRAGAAPDIVDHHGWTALMSAVVTGDVDTVASVLAAGASVNLLNHDKKCALNYAIRDKYRRIGQMLRAAGGMTGEELNVQNVYSPTSDGKARTPRDVAQPDFTEAAQSPEFRRIAEEMSALCQDSGRPLMDDYAGGLRFNVTGNQLREIIEEWQDRYSRQGVYLFQCEAQNGLGLLPTSKQYDVVAVMQTSAPNYDLGTGDIIDWLRQLEKDQPFVLTGIGYDFVQGKFTSVIKNSKKLAKRIYEFCPDTVDQGAGTVANLALELKRTNGLFLWWD
jgi:Domain of unknown function (DUF4253)/Ankyrin repeats (3 copies)/Ankyrin repeat